MGALARSVKVASVRAKTGAVHGAVVAVGQTESPCFWLEIRILFCCGTESTGEHGDKEEENRRADELHGSKCLLRECDAIWQRC